MEINPLMNVVFVKRGFGNKAFSKDIKDHILGNLPINAVFARSFFHEGNI
jgi:hypothetical protein